MSKMRNLLQEMIARGQGASKDADGVEKFAALARATRAIDGDEAARNSIEQGELSKLTASSKDDLVRIGTDLRNMCGDQVHVDGSTVETMWRWVDARIDGFRKQDVDVMVAEIGEIDRRLQEIQRELGSPVAAARREEIVREVRGLGAERARALASYEEVMRAVGFGRYLASRDGQLGAVCLARWAANGYPQIVMGHKYAAALLATNVSPDVLELVRAPWNGLVIEVPSDLLTLFHPELGRRIPITRILVAQHANIHGGEHAWMYVAMTETVMTCWRFGVSTAELLPPTLEKNMFADDPTQLEIDDQDERVQSLVGRLIVNVCLAMSDPELVKEIGAGHKRYAEARRHGGDPPEATVRTFQVGRPVKVDYRAEIAAYVEGGAGARRALNKQWLTAGHYKRQHHGPKNSLVKTIWREPYWCGPEDAPIAVRPHLLGKEPVT